MWWYRYFGPRQSAALTIQLPVPYHIFYGLLTLVSHSICYNLTCDPPGRLDSIAEEISELQKKVKHQHVGARSTHFGCCSSFCSLYISKKIKFNSLRIFFNFSHYGSLNITIFCNEKHVLKFSK